LSTNASKDVNDEDTSEILFVKMSFEFVQGCQDYLISFSGHSVKKVVFWCVIFDSEEEEQEKEESVD